MNERKSDEAVPCPLCGSHSFSEVMKGRDLLYGKGGEFLLVRCGSCSLVYINPRPSGKRLSDYYRDDYFQLTIEPDTRGTIRERALIAITLMKDTYLVNWLKRHVSLEEDRRVLDVGCGIGGFLIALRDRFGVAGTGVETIPDIVRSLREKQHIEIIEGDFMDEGLIFRRAPFDLITMWHFLEHVARPRHCLDRAYGLLAENGCLALEVPNFAGLNARLFGEHWLGLCLPTHLTHFEPPSLARILKESGFEVISMSHGLFPLFLTGSLQLKLFGSTYYGDVRKNLGRLLFFSLLESPFSRFFALLGRGDVLRVIARKRTWEGAGSASDQS